MNHAWRSTPTPIALFVKVNLSRACNDYNLTFLSWCEMTNLSANFFISQTFALSLTDNTFVILKTPCSDSWDIQDIFLHNPFARSWCLHLLGNFLVACICAWRHFLGVWLYSNYNIGHQNFERVLYLILPTVYWICFFCYIALSILSPRVCLKERVVALWWGNSICPEVVLWHWIVSLHKRVFPEWQEIEVKRDIKL